MAAEPEPQIPAKGARPKDARSESARILFLFALGLSAGLNLYRLGQVGFRGLGNPYYAAAVQTMSRDWRLFWYLGIDPAGFIALDKAPLAFWLQTLLVRLLGFHGWVMLLPQALAGIASVCVLHGLVSRSHGPWAGTLSALALALSPISVVTQRNNMPDALLVLALLLAAAALERSLSRNRPWGLLWVGVWLGLAFNLKMLQLLLVAPALVLCYLVGSSQPWGRRLLWGLGLVAMAILVAAPWVLFVTLTPATARPYVGSTAGNSVLELIWHYNGWQRLWAEDWSVLLGPPSPFRLWGPKLGGQIGWLLWPALLGLIVAVATLRAQPKHLRDATWLAQRQALWLWGAWMLFSLAYFSISIFWHSYYLATMAPSIAALAGIGGVALWRLYQEGQGWQRLLLPLAMGSSALLQIWLLWPPGVWFWRLAPAILVFALAACVLWIVPRYRNQRRIARLAAGLGLVALLAAPTVWAAIPVFTCVHGWLPEAGPQPRPCSTDIHAPIIDPELCRFLLDNRQGARYLAATHDMGIAELLILATGEPAMCLGGYRGNDPILTVEQFAALVERGEVRYYLALSDEAEYPVQQPLREWVAAHCPRQEPLGVQVWGPCECSP